MRLYGNDSCELPKSFDTLSVNYCYITNHSKTCWLKTMIYYCSRFYKLVGTPLTSSVVCCCWTGTCCGLLGTPTCMEPPGTSRSARPPAGQLGLLPVADEGPKRKHRGTQRLLRVEPGTSILSLPPHRVVQGQSQGQPQFKWGWRVDPLPEGRSCKGCRYREGCRIVAICAIKLSQSPGSHPP